MIRSISDLYTQVKERKTRKKLVLAAAEDRYALAAVSQAGLNGYIHPVLVGDINRIEQIAREDQINLSHADILDVRDQQEAVEVAVQMVARGQGDILMKGACPTALLLKAVLNKEWGLRDQKLLSHVALFDLKDYHKLLAISDVAIHIAPDVDAKTEIVSNAVGFLAKLGIDQPRIALVAAVEKVYDSMPATVDAAAVIERIRKLPAFSGQIDGPFALDNALDRESALHKGIVSDVAGDADLLIMPQIESGNVLYKALSLFASPRIAAMVIGARAPIVLTSRADSEETKLNSIVLGAAIC